MSWTAGEPRGAVGPAGSVPRTPGVSPGPRVSPAPLCQWPALHLGRPGRAGLAAARPAVPAAAGAGHCAVSPEGHTEGRGGGRDCERPQWTINHRSSALAERCWGRGAGRGGLLLQGEPLYPAVPGVSSHSVCRAPVSGYPGVPISRCVRAPCCSCPRCLSVPISLCGGRVAAHGACADAGGACAWRAAPAGAVPRSPGRGRCPRAARALYRDLSRSVATCGERGRGVGTGTWRRGGALGLGAGLPPVRPGAERGWAASGRAGPGLRQGRGESGRNQPLPQQ